VRFVLRSGQKQHNMNSSAIGTSFRIIRLLLRLVFPYTAGMASKQQLSLPFKPNPVDY